MYRFELIYQYASETESFLSRTRICKVAHEIRVNKNSFTSVGKRKVNLYRITVKIIKLILCILNSLLEGQERGCRIPEEQNLLKQTRQKIVITLLISRLHKVHRTTRSCNNRPKAPPNIAERRLRILQIYRNRASEAILVCSFKLWYQMPAPKTKT